MKGELAALWLAWKDPRTPFWAKFFAGATVIYALSPVDLVPDFIPVLGYLDDMLILPLLALVALRLIPKELLAQCRQRAQTLWQQGRPKAWRYAWPVVLIWLLLLFWLCWAIFWR